MARKHKRESYLSEIALEFESGNRETRISDLGVGGCFVDSIVDVSVGEAVTLKISMDPGVQLKLKGTVAYILQGQGFGVTFTGLSEMDKTALKSMVSGAAERN